MRNFGPSGGEVLGMTPNRFINARSSFQLLINFLTGGPQLDSAGQSSALVCFNGVGLFTDSLEALSKKLCLASEWLISRNTIYLRTRSSDSE